MNLSPERPQWITATATVSTRQVTSSHIHNRKGRAAVSTPGRWARSPHDQRSHLLAERGADQSGVQLTACGHRLPWPVDADTEPTGNRCPTCARQADWPVPAPQFGNSPTSGGPAAQRPVERQTDTTPQAEQSSAGPLRWAHNSEDGLMHLLSPDEVVAATILGEALAVCGCTIPASGLTLTTGSLGARCTACVIGQITETAGTGWATPST